MSQTCKKCAKHRKLKEGLCKKCRPKPQGFKWTGFIKPQDQDPSIEMKQIYPKP